MSSFELAPVGKKCPFFGGKLELQIVDGAVVGGKIVPCDCRENVMSGICDDGWLHIAGKNPLTGESLNKWMCVHKAGWMFGADAAKKANETSVDVIKLTNMVFDPEYRHQELTRSKIEPQQAIGST